MLRHVERAIQPFQLRVDFADRVDREDAVLVRRRDQQRTRRNQRGHVGEIPHRRVRPPHAVAVAVDDAVVDVGRQGGRAADRRAGLDALVRRRDVPRLRAAAGDAGRAEPGRIDFGPRREQIEAADAVEHLDRGWRVAAAVPVEPALAIAAVVIAGHLAELHGLDDQRREAELRQPPRMPLVVHLLFLRVTAHVENAGPAGRGGGRRGHVEVRRHVQVRQALVVQLLDPETLALDDPGDLVRDRSAFGGRTQIAETERAQELLAALAEPPRDLGRTLQIVDGVIGDPARFAHEVVADRDVRRMRCLSRSRKRT